jgi:hypothetical protein
MILYVAAQSGRRIQQTSAQDNNQNHVRHGLLRLRPSTSPSAEEVDILLAPDWWNKTYPTNQF